MNGHYGLFMYFVYKLLFTKTILVFFLEPLKIYFESAHAPVMLISDFLLLISHVTVCYSTCNAGSFGAFYAFVIIYE